jgi:hypothetical protein
LHGGRVGDGNAVVFVVIGEEGDRRGFVDDAPIKKSDVPVAHELDLPGVQDNMRQLRW